MPRSRCYELVQPTFPSWWVASSCCSRASTCANSCFDVSWFKDVLWRELLNPTRFLLSSGKVEYLEIPRPLSYLVRTANTTSFEELHRFHFTPQQLQQLMTTTHEARSKVYKKQENPRKYSQSSAKSITAGTQLLIPRQTIFFKIWSDLPSGYLTVCHGKSPCY